ncbi:hypothetical protein HI806_01960 [Ralstonia solanacearum]|nr:hypothetical protein BCR16_01865 [Ralstonia solanacearum FJAT-1458]QKL70126.1 hypothetical protein HI806_01960 [Ralstonia solanacearum]QKL75340.1 hypothetical protein HI805_01965 [Ralstonia solanacearum]QKL80541.1 hypothetical protein HI804_01970 [Ralstonia solanacearum]QKL85754.1 hypothetical protein HI803_01970 [Ralstonia solanacearum]
MEIAGLGNLMRALDDTLDDEAKRQVRETAEADLWQMHLGLNALIRSIAYHRNSSTVGRSFFDRLGTPDDGSAVLGMVYWWHVLGISPTKEMFAAALQQHILWFSVQESDALSEEMLASYVER